MREQHIDCEFEAIGTLNVYRDPANFEKACVLVGRLAEFGVRGDVLDAAATLAREPAPSPASAGALFHPDDASCDRIATSPNSHASCTCGRWTHRGGCACRRPRRRTDGSRIAQVVASNRRHAGREVVLALGARGRRGSRATSACASRSQPGKGYSITYTRPARCPRLPLTLKEPSVCVTAWGSGYRLGSTMEFAGYDERLDRVRLDALRRGAAGFLFEPERAEVVEEWWPAWRPMIRTTCR